jgi:predicted AAA+ superfamily ATPase
LIIHVSESLAGRLSLLELTPFLWSELPIEARRQLWLCGGFPDGGVIEGGNYPQWQRDYVTILTQRDLPNWGLPAKPQTTSRLLRMLAALHGQAWNATQVGQSMGLDYKTVNSYLDFLVGAFLIRRLQPYQANIRKRLVKSPKVFWRDTGLLHGLLNVPDREALLAQPWVGASWEGFVIEQVLGFLSTKGNSFEPYYFRTNDQYELDLVLDFGKELWAVEVKLTASPTAGDMDRLNQTADLIKAKRRFLVSNTATSVGTGASISCNLDGLLKYLDE